MRLDVVEVLGRIGDERAARALCEAYLTGDEELLGTILVSLAQLTWQPEEPDQDAIHASAHRDWYRCTDIGAPAVDALLLAL